MKTLFAAALLIAAFGLAGTAAADPHAGHAGHLADIEHYAELVDRPAPGFALLDLEGKPVSLDDFQGKAVVLWFIYANCPDVCPLHTDSIAAVQQLVNAGPLKDRVEFVAITTDPVRDTPEILEGFARAHGLDSANATLLSSGAGQPDATRALAESFGVSFMPMEDGMQMHAAVMHLIDPTGKVRARYHGLEFEPENAVTHLEALTGDTGLLDRFLSLFQSR